MWVSFNRVLIIVCFPQLCSVLFLDGHLDSGAKLPWLDACREVAGKARWLIACAVHPRLPRRRGC